MPGYWSVSRFSIPMTTLTSSVNCYPNQVVPIDVNGDGLLDLIISYGDWNYVNEIPVTVMLNNGDGTFSDGTSIVFPQNVPGVNTANE